MPEELEKDVVLDEDPSSSQSEDMLAFLATSFSTSVVLHTLLANNVVFFGPTSAVWIGEVLEANPENGRFQSDSLVKLTECGGWNRLQDGGKHVTC